jgi:UDP-N-acetylglucosamine enolpyruvyl transferase
MGLLSSALISSGYNVVYLKKTTEDMVETGLKYVNNDACYPAIIVIGQILSALKSEKYDLENTSVIISQTGGGCRATNYIGLIRKALKDAGFEKVPIISFNVNGLEKNQSQGDKLIIETLEQMGADITWDKKAGTVTIKGGRQLNAITFDAGATPDLVPTLAVLASAAKGTSRIENAEHVRYKETDRLRALATELPKLGVKLKEEKDSLTITGGKLHGATVHGWDDHRIVMALAVAGIVAGDTTIDTTESVSISYPEFFKDIRSLGAKIEQIPEE